MNAKAKITKKYTLQTKQSNTAVKSNQIQSKEVPITSLIITSQTTYRKFRFANISG